MYYKQSKLEKAENLENSLNFARNSYERKLIHEKCEYLFGCSSPRKIINQCNKTISQNIRSLEKLEERALNIGLKASRVINKIVIDGNNLCYSGNVLIGIEPLKSLVDILSKEHEIVLVFDASIKKILTMNNDSLNALFNNIQPHIVQAGKSADELIVEIADNDSTCFILSNDRFGDYRDKEVVYNERIINHEIVDNRVIITELGINIKYQ